MDLRRQYALLPVLVLVALLMLVHRSAEGATADASSIDEQVCDPLADYFLGVENYAEAVRRHRAVIGKDPGNALAHYHLGFAYGLIGRHDEELAEYQKAIDLGLSDWQLFLNLGLLYLESGKLDSAIEVLRLAALLGPDRPETHFNLALAYERRGLLAQARQELLLSLQIDPNQPDARNALAAIYAEEGKYGRAHEEWSDLVKADPSYAPARANLDILKRVEREKQPARDAPAAQAAP